MIGLADIVMIDQTTTHTARVTVLLRERVLAVDHETHAMTAAQTAGMEASARAVPARVIAATSREVAVQIATNVALRRAHPISIPAKPQKAALRTLTMSSSSASRPR